MSRRSGRYLAGVAALVVLAAIAAGLAIVGSPAAARRRQTDRTRIEQLRRIAGAVNLHWTRRGTVPASLEEIGQDEAALPRRDPAGDAYAYRSVDDRTFELCARFDDASPAAAGGDFWQHQSGRQCFQVVAQQVRP